MKFRMDKIVRELVEESWEWARLGRIGGFPDRDVVFAETLVELESQGDAMRFVDSRVALHGKRRQTCAIISMI